MKVLGISAFYHDSAAAIVVDGKIIAASQEERFSRIKHDSAFPSNAISFCLSYAKIDISELDAIVFYDKPLLKFERLLETYYALAPKGWKSFVSAMPVWLKEKLFLKRFIKKELSDFGNVDWSQCKMLFPEHHLSHAASAFYPSPFEEAAILTMDGVGEWATTTICHGKGNSIEIKSEIRFPHSLGLLYSAFTYFLGFEVNSGEYKLMGLAPYGNIDDGQTLEYIDTIKNELVSIYDDGSYSLHMKQFSFATTLRMVDDSKWQRLFNLPRRKAEDAITQEHCNLALAIQKVTEEIVVRLARAAKTMTGCKYLCLSGGVALNCVANGIIDEAGIFEGLFIQPASGDAGGSIGAALATEYIFYNAARSSDIPDGMQGALLGPEYNNEDIELFLKENKVIHKKYTDEALMEMVADLIVEGKVIGWFQGRMEFGPRALGNRSILGNPQLADMQMKINKKIKFRESFRPFAPAVLKEDCQKYFQHDSDSSYMLMVKQIQDHLKHKLPEDYPDKPMMDKLFVERSMFPGITHVDFSARIQTVDDSTNKRFYHLLQAVKEKSGHGLVINTSFNVKDEPIVCSPKDAYNCFLKTDMDVLVMGNFIILKSAVS